MTPPRHRFGDTRLCARDKALIVVASLVFVAVTVGFMVLDAWIWTFFSG